MRGLNRLGKISGDIIRNLYSWRFRLHCSRVGRGLQVLGPCVVHNHGVIEIGDNLVIRSRRFNQVEISVGSAAQLQIGHKVFLNQGVRIACSTQIQIGNRCQIGDESVILDSDYHAIGDSTVKTLSVHLEDDVWLATRVIVLRGVTIGKGSVIGAGSVVTRSIPSCTFAAGVPARVLRSLPPR